MCAEDNLCYVNRKNLMKNSGGSLETNGGWFLSYVSL